MFVWFIKILLSELTPFPTPVPLPSWSPFPPFPYENFSCPDCICTGFNLTCPTPYPIPPCPECPSCPNVSCPTPYPIPPCPPCPSLPPSPTPWPSPTSCPPLTLREHTFGCLPNRPIMQWTPEIYPVSLFLTNQLTICGMDVSNPQFITSIQCHELDSPCLNISRMVDISISYITFSIARIIIEGTVTEEILVSCYHPVNQLRRSFSFIHTEPSFNISVINSEHGASIYVNRVVIKDYDNNNK